MRVYAESTSGKRPTTYDIRKRRVQLSDGNNQTVTEVNSVSSRTTEPTAEVNLVDVRVINEVTSTCMSYLV